MTCTLRHKNSLTFHYYSIGVYRKHLKVFAYSVCCFLSIHNTRTEEAGVPLLALSMYAAQHVLLPLQVAGEEGLPIIKAIILAHPYTFVATIVWSDLIHLNH